MQVSINWYHFSSRYILLLVFLVLRYRNDTRHRSANEIKACSKYPTIPWIKALDKLLKDINLSTLLICSLSDKKFNYKCQPINSAWLRSRWPLSKWKGDKSFFFPCENHTNQRGFNRLRELNLWPPINNGKGKTLVKWVVAPRSVSCWCRLSKIQIFFSHLFIFSLRPSLSMEKQFHRVITDGRSFIKRHWIMKRNKHARGPLSLYSLSFCVFFSHSLTR